MASVKEEGSSSSSSSSNTDNYYDDKFDEPEVEHTKTNSPKIKNNSEKHHISTNLEWERWRLNAEVTWRDELRDKELKLREQLEKEVKESGQAKLAGIQTAQEQTIQLEIRLRNALDAVERQKAKLLASEDAMSSRLTQKTGE